MESFRLVEIRKMANPLQAIQRMDKNQPRIKTTCLFDKSLKLLHSGEVDRVKYRKRKSKAIVSLSTTVRSFSYNLLRRNEFVEWHVAWLAEWHNYAECNICRIKKIKLKKLKIAPLFGANQYSQAATVLLWCCGLDYDDNQKARKDSLISLGRLAFPQPQRFYSPLLLVRLLAVPILHHESRPLKKDVLEATLSSALIFFCQRFLHN